MFFSYFMAKFNYEFITGIHCFQIALQRFTFINVQLKCPVSPFIETENNFLNMKYESPQNINVKRQIPSTKFLHHV